MLPNASLTLFFAAFATGFFGGAFFGATFFGGAFFGGAFFGATCFVVIFFGEDFFAGRAVFFGVLFFGFVLGGDDFIFVANLPFVFAAAFAFAIVLARVTDHRKFGVLGTVQARSVS